MRSFQRFELGESGDGRHLLAKAERAGDAQYTRALALLVAEEQRHSGLFARGLDHLGGASLPGHWSNTAFTALRRALGLRTELGLFLVAESVAVEYFGALAAGAPDPVLRAIGRRLENDERITFGSRSTVSRRPTRVGPAGNAGRCGGRCWPSASARRSCWSPTTGRRCAPAAGARSATPGGPCATCGSCSTWP